MIIMIGLAVRSNPDHLPALLAGKRFRRGLGKSTSLSWDKGISVSGRIDDNRWPEESLAGSIKLQKI